MYKVFINDKIICFTNNVEDYNQFSGVLILRFFSSKITPIIVDLALNSKKIEIIIVVVDAYEKAFHKFQTYFKIIKAAGGIVSNNENKKLFIYRLDKWDLPKGKIESGEEIEETAIREIEEECGISDLKINKQLTETFHIYSLEETLVLKQTFWFDMKSNYEGKLIPQLEEGITKAEWLLDDQIKDKVLKNTYASIKELLKTSGY